MIPILVALILVLRTSPPQETQNLHTRCSMSSFRRGVVQCSCFPCFLLEGALRREIARTTNIAPSAKFIAVSVFTRYATLSGSQYNFPTQDDV